MTHSTSQHRAVAERYIDALLDGLSGDAVLDATGNDLDHLATLLEQSDDLSHTLTDPTIARREKAAALDAVLTKGNAGTETKQLIALLARNNRLEILPSLIVLFHEKRAALRGEVVLEITTASELDKQSADSISGSLEKATGKKTLLKLVTDPDLIGGIIIRLGSVLMDYSVRGKLSRLEMSLGEHIANS